ncbi:MAG: 3-phenylpropionate/cinnamic acid dioxygenase subunit beta [Gammaproteobacteria bacterium]
MSSTAEQIAPQPEKPSLELISEIEQFLYREARYQDARQYREWQKMLTRDIHYWLPALDQRYRKNEQQPNPAHIAHYNDRYEDIDTRIRRTETGTCWSEDPPTRCAHLVNNVEVVLTDHPDEFIVHSLITVHRNMNEDEEHTLFGRREDLLRREAGELKLAKRRIILAQNIFLSKSLNVYL